jgi:uncharacterized protein DUF397
MRYNVARRRPELSWEKSTLCQTSDCVEIAPNNGYVVLRSSTQPRRQLRFTQEEWRAFAAGLRAGDFHDLG